MIINQVVSGGGTTPTGTIQITTNGTHDVTNYATADVQVPTTAPALYREFELTGAGILIPNTTTTHIMDFTGVTDIGDSALFGAYSQNTNITGAVNFPSLTTLTGSSACEHMFNLCTGITSVDMSNLATITGSSVCHRMFFGCTGITSVNLSSLTTIGTASCGSMFTGCTGLTTADLPSLTSIGTSAATDMFSGCSGLTTANLGKLQTISGANALSRMFSNCTRLTSVNLDSLTQITGAGQAANPALKETFSGTGLTTIEFKSLKSMSNYCFNDTCKNCTNLQSVWFYVLSSLGGNTRPFANSWLTGVTGCTVHFPIAIQSTIETVPYYPGFGGTNTTVLFDLVTSLTGADGNTYTRQEKDSTSTATAWVYNDTLYYTSGVSDHTNGVNEPSVSDAIYSDAACTQSVTTITAIA